MRAPSITTTIPLLVAAALATGCAHATSARSDAVGAVERRPAPNQDYNRISFAEIVSLRNQAFVPTAYDIVERSRPLYLRPRAVSFTGGDGPVVYLDNFYLGGPATLRQIDSRTVEEIRYGWSRESIARPGRAANARVIYVRTARYGEP